jgi:hypothetical protein
MKVVVTGKEVFQVCFEAVAPDGALDIDPAYGRHPGV